MTQNIRDLCRIRFTGRTETADSNTNTLNNLLVLALDFTY